MVPEVLAASIVILLFSVIVHEVMHGLAALYFGDTTAKQAGRLTLNPIPHIDLVGSILLPGSLLLMQYALPGIGSFVVGWAKPVPVNPLNFRDIRRGELVVSLAGVGANFILAIIGAIIFHLTNLSSIQAQIIYYLININLLLAVFNLLPIPPLDGSKVVASLLPVELEIKYRSLEPYGMWIILFLLVFPFNGPSFLMIILGFLVGILRSLLGI